MWWGLIIVGITALGGLCESKAFIKLIVAERTEAGISIPCNQKHVASCAKAEVHIGALLEDHIEVPGNVTLKIHKRTNSSATFKSDDGTEAIFAWDHSDNIAGHVQAQDQTFYLETCGPTCYVWITLDGQWDEEEEISGNFITNETRTEVKSAEDSTTVVTFSVMVWYTPEFRALFADQGAMDVFVDLIFAETNQGYENSQIPVRAKKHCLRLHPTLHDVEKSSTMIRDFATSMSISKLKGSADAATLLVADFSGCGVAYTNTTSSCYTLSVVEKICATGYYSFGHEIGHNFGAKHNVEKYKEGISKHPYEYGHGYLIQPPGAFKNSGYRTILAYATDHHKTRVNYYSSPNVIFPKTSTATGKLPYADNAKVITDNRFAMAKCGDESSTCEAIVTSTTEKSVTSKSTTSIPTTSKPTTSKPVTSKPVPSKACKPRKNCSKKKGKCYGKNDIIPTNFKYLGYCNKKAGCKCYRKPVPPKKCKPSKICSRKKGKCYRKTDTIPTNSTYLGYCSKKAGCKCYGSTLTSKPKPNPKPKPKCKPNKKCSQKGGKCYRKTDTIPTNSTYLGYCSKKAGCKCYGSTLTSKPKPNPKPKPKPVPPKKCKPSKICSRKKGKCYRKTDTIPTNSAYLGYCSKKAGCKCYGSTLTSKPKPNPKPKPKCKPNKKCSQKGGSCLRKFDSIPSGAKWKGYCNKKAKCGCYVTPKPIGS